MNKSVKEVREYLEGNVQDEPFVIYEVSYDGETRIFLQSYEAITSAYRYIHGIEIPKQATTNEYGLDSASEALRETDSIYFESDDEPCPLRTTTIWKREVS